MSAAEPPLRVLVLEDEPPARAYLRELLLDTGRVEVVAAVATLAEARAALADAHALDAAFVDVQLAGHADEAAGLRFASDLARAVGAPRCVLATAHARHALRAFELGVVDYLLKPFTAERVEHCVARLVAQRAPRPPASDEREAPTRVVARDKKALVFLSLRDVWAFEAEARLTFVHSAEGRFDVDPSLAALEAQLGVEVCRVHRNWLVNLAHVRSFERDGGDAWLRVGSASGLRVPVARERAGAVRELLLRSSVGARIAIDRVE